MGTGSKLGLTCSGVECLREGVQVEQRCRHRNNRRKAKLDRLQRQGKASLILWWIASEIAEMNSEGFV